MFYGGNVFKKIKLLSGGERLRLKLSKLLFSEINLLILDEPTNHLDTNSIESMEEALAGFKGTIFFISHDRYFINKISDRVIAIEEGAFHSYLGNYDYYKSIKDKQRQQVEEVLSVKPEKQRDKQNNDRKKVPLKVERKEAYAAKLESRIRNIEDRLKEIEVSIEAVGTNYEELNRLFEKKEKLSKDLEETMEVWLSMS
jgi:ATPase subunit of ABC transporter with duplicated ATPase domains